MKERANPSINEIWRHFKDREYKIIIVMTPSKEVIRYFIAG